MQNRLKNFIKENEFFVSNDKLILAVSGGKDSVAMAHLFSQLEFDFVIAHCNFMLREAESNEDALFVKKLAQKLDVSFYCKEFETKKYAKDHKVSIQMAARDLRYQWLNHLTEKYNCTKIVTAHHKDDSIETLLIKKSRKASLEALRGILPTNGKLVRPLLCFTNKEIVTFIDKNNFEYREDSSNKSLDYQRNYIRNVTLPQLEKKNDKIRTILMEEIKSNQESFDLIKDISLKVNELYFYPIDNGFRLELSWIDEIKEYQEVLYQILKQFGPFNWKDVFNLLNSDNGKLVSNPKFRIIKERSCLEISRNIQPKSQTFILNENDFELTQLNLFFEKIDVKGYVLKENILFLDHSKLVFPLQIRKWKIGDKFQPLGMNGSKKISDFLIDLKCSTLQKENTWLLCQENKIIALIGYRIDEYYKIDKKTKFVFKIISNKKQ